MWEVKPFSLTHPSLTTLIILVNYAVGMNVNLSKQFRSKQLSIDCIEIFSTSFWLLYLGNDSKLATVLSCGFCLRVAQGLYIDFSTNFHIVGSPLTHKITLVKASNKIELDISLFHRNDTIYTYNRRSRRSRKLALDWRYFQ